MALQQYSLFDKQPEKNWLLYLELDIHQRINLKWNQGIGFAKIPYSCIHYRKYYKRDYELKLKQPFT